MKRTKLFLTLFIFLFLAQFFLLIPCTYAVTTNSNTITAYSPSCLLMETSTGKILYEKNAYEVRYPASTTKMMTAILALEHCELTEKATVSHNAIYSIPPDYVHASLREGEEFTIEELLNALLIYSANDVAVVIAEHISGSVEKFSDLMNEKAKEIGCKNTHFVNPNGIHNKNHTSTAYDLALIGKYAMQNPTIREIVIKPKCSLPATSKYPKSDRIFKSTNDLIIPNTSKAKDNYYYKNATGIKTGYTGDAGSCIVASAKKDNMEVIVVVLGASFTKEGLSEKFLDCIHLFDYAFKHYQLKTIHEKNSVGKQITVSGGTKDSQNLNLLVKEEISILLSQNDSTYSDPEITLKEDLKAPITAGEAVRKNYLSNRWYYLFF